MERQIVHISGASASGKTTLGKRIALAGGSNVVVKDLDDMFWNQYLPAREMCPITLQQFTEHFPASFQTFIDCAILEIGPQKHIVFVGIDGFHVGEVQRFKCLDAKMPNTTFDFTASKKYYIDIPVEQVLRQRFEREVDFIYSTRERLFQDLLADSDKARRRLVEDIPDFNRWRKETATWDALYESRGYTALTSDEIFDSLSDIIQTPADHAGHA